MEIETRTPRSRRETGERMIAVGRALAERSPLEIGSDSELVRLAVADGLG